MSSSTSSAALWTGRVLSTLVILFLLMDAIMKFFKPAIVVEITVNQLGYPEWSIIPIGVILLACTILYVLPQTSILGAVLLTGYLGGAIATHVRVGHLGFEIIFPLIIAAMIWGGLYLRDPRVRAMVGYQPDASVRKS